MTARRDTSGWSGTVELAGGGRHEFSATPATGEAGLFWLASIQGNASTLGGWIRLADGTVRGKQTVTTAQGADSASSEPAAEPVASGGGGTVPPAAEPTPDKGVLRCALAYVRFSKAVKAMNDNPSSDNIILRNAAAIEVQRACGST